MNGEIAENLTALRKQNNLSQEELAEKLCVSRQAVSKWERGEALPDTDNLIRLARLYGVSLDDLLLVHSVKPESCAEPISDTVSDSVTNTDSADTSVNSFTEFTVTEDAFEYNDQSYDTVMVDKRGKIVGHSKYVSGAFPIIIAAIYLGLGVFLNWWHPSWIIFLSIPIYYTIPWNKVLSGQVSWRKAMRGCFPILVTTVFLLLGFTFGNWHPAWMLFLTIPIYYIIQ